MSGEKGDGRRPRLRAGNSILDPRTVDGRDPLLYAALVVANENEARRVAMTAAFDRWKDTMFLVRVFLDNISCVSFRAILNLCL
mmetsp:Transcript_31793/g.77010  ORF Transcript_31793/g.77010 Transcript_31793/m.77010 type:complete len:84 (+) Transcript_31793:1783-2034(+)